MSDFLLIHIDFLKLSKKPAADEEDNAKFVLSSEEQILLSNTTQGTPWRLSENQNRADPTPLNSDHDEENKISQDDKMADGIKIFDKGT